MERPSPKYKAKLGRLNHRWAKTAITFVRAVSLPPQQRLDLDYCGVDFSLLPDGRVLVFEANATMLVHPEPENGPLAHKNPAVATICEAFQALLRR